MDTKEPLSLSNLQVRITGHDLQGKTANCAQHVKIELCSLLPFVISIIRSQLEINKMHFTLTAPPPNEHKINIIEYI